MPVGCSNIQKGQVILPAVNEHGPQLTTLACVARGHSHSTEETTGGITLGGETHSAAVAVTHDQ